MPSKALVAALRTSPDRVLQDYDRLFELANAPAHLAPGATTILKDNISWHFPFPAANTTPWQLEGTVRALNARGYGNQVCVQNKTVVTDAFKGEDLNGYLPIFREYGIPVLYNFKDEDMKWVDYRPRAEMLVLPKIFPEGIHVPDFFFGKNIVHLPTVKCVSGDTEVVLGDGSVVAIRDLVARALDRAPCVLLGEDGEQRAEGQVEVMAMGQDGLVRPHPASWVWRTAAHGRRVLRARTRTGRSLTATVDHPVYTPAGWRPLGELAVGARLAVARRIAVPGESQPLPRFAEAEGSLAPVVVGQGGRKDTMARVQDVLDSSRGGATATAVVELRPRASEDLAWDELVMVEEVPADSVDLYDLTVPGAGSFVANGLIVHNCHIYTTTTGAMKNAFGGLLNTRRHLTHSWIHETLVDLLHIQKEIHSGLFAVMDGTTAGNGPGPRTMFPEVKNVILASGDQVAIDAVAAKLMGIDPLSIPYIRLAHEAGLGIGDPRAIDLAGDADLANESWGFSVGDNGASRIGDLIWFGPLRPIQHVFMRTPLVNAFIFGSEAYHDYYRWPMRDRRTFESWLAHTPWGHLFQAYRRAGVPQHPSLARTA